MVIEIGSSLMNPDAGARIFLKRPSGGIVEAKKGKTTSAVDDRQRS